MDSPYGIAQVDVPGLLSSYQGMKQQRLEQLYRQKQLERQDKIDERADKEYNRGEQVREGLSSAYDPASGKIDPGKARAAYVGAGDIGGALKFDEGVASQRAAELKNWSTLNDYSLQLLGGVHDQTTYDQARAQAKAMYDQYGQGQHFPELPPVYDPGTVRQLQMRSLSAKEQLQAAADEAKAAEAARHNRATEGNAAGNLAVRQGALGLASKREGRAGGAGAAHDFSGMSDEALINLATGQ